MRKTPRLEADNFVALILHAAKGDDGDGGGQICRPTAVTRSDASQTRVKSHSQASNVYETSRWTDTCAKRWHRIARAFIPLISILA